MGHISWGLTSPFEPPMGPRPGNDLSSLWSWCPAGLLCSPFTAPNLSPLPPSCGHTLLLPSLCGKFKPRTIHCMPAPSSNRNHQSLTKINEPLLSARDQGLDFFFPKILHIYRGEALSGSPLPFLSRKISLSPMTLAHSYRMNKGSA